MIVDLPPPLWTKPAVIRAASLDLRRQPAMFLPGFAGAPRRFTTWNPADKGSGLTLSDGDLTVSWSGSGQWAVRASRALSAGKWYWEITPAAMTASSLLGIAKSTASLNSYCGSDANGWGWYGANGSVLNNASSLITLSTYGSGDVLGVAFDVDAGKLYFRKNGAWENGADLAAGTGAVVTALMSGPYYPAASDGSSGADNGALTTNFGASAFAYAPPAGFSGVTAA